MYAKVMSSDAVRSGWRTVVDEVVAGQDVVAERYGKPVVAVIRYADYMALLEQLEDLRDLQAAEAAYAAHLRDPSGARAWEDVKAEWDARDAAATSG